MKVDLSRVTTLPLTLTIDRVNDYLLAVETGYVVDGKPEREYLGVDESFAYVLREPEGEIIGFVVNDVSEYDWMSAGGIWHESALTVPEFTIPSLPIDSGTAGELIASALAIYDGILTANALTFHHAINTGEGTDIDAWRMCLATGELRAHYGLGYSLWEADRFAEAYTHLRHYADLVPYNSWAWCWLGKACVSMGEMNEARDAFQRALAIEEQGGFETDAEELLASIPDA